MTQPPSVGIVVFSTVTRMPSVWATCASRFAVIAVLVGAVTLGGCDGKQGPSIDDLLSRAQAHRASGDLKAAVIELKNAIQKEPGHKRARYSLGEVYVEVGDGAAAEVELRRAEGDQAATALLLGRALLLQGKYENLLKEISAEDQRSTKDKAVALALRGHALVGVGRIDDAEASYKAALAADDACAEAIVGLGRMALGQRDLDMARRWATTAEAVAPNDPKSLLLRGEVAFYARDYDASQRAFELIRKSHRHDAIAYAASIGLTRTLIAANKLKEAIAALAPLLRDSPRDPATNHLRALAAYQSRDYVAAQYYSEIAVSVQPDHWQGLFLAAAANFALGQNERAAKYLSHFVAQFPENVGARSLLAEVQAKMGQPGDALKTLKAGIPESGAADPDLMGLIGAMIAQAGDLSDARTYFEQVASARPQDAIARARLGVARIALGDSAGGIADLDAAAALDGALWQVDFARAVAFLRLNDFSQALAAARRMQASQPDNPYAATLIGVAESATGALTEAKQAFENALLLRPGDGIALRNLAALAVRQQRFDEARRYYDLLITASPGDPALLIAYGQLELRAARPQAAMAMFEKAVAANPDAATPRVEIARAYLALGEPQKALAAAQQILKRSQNDRAAQEVVGRAYLALSQLPEAVAQLRALTIAAPDSPSAHVYLAAAYERSGDFAGALAALQKAMLLMPDDIDMRIERARLLALAGQRDESRTALAKLRAEVPDSPILAMAEGAVAMAAKQPAEAVLAYQRAFAAQPSSAVLASLTNARRRAGLLAEAEQALNDWLRQHPEDVFARTTLADFYLSTGNFARASVEYGEIDRRSSDNVMVINNLAWSLIEQGRARDAMPYARRAAALAPADPNVLDTLGTALLHNKSFSEAVIVLRRAREKAPADAGIQIRLAQALAQDGSVGEAKSLLRKVLSEAKANDERAEAEALLRQLGG